MGFSEQELRLIIQQTVESIIGGNAGVGQDCLFDDMNDAIAAAKQAQTKLMMMSLGGWFGFVMTVSGFVKEFVLVFAAYVIIAVIDFIRVKRVPKTLALKNVE